MKEATHLILFLIFSTYTFGQEVILNKSVIPKLNSLIKTAEEEYAKSATPSFKSVRQTTGSYFELVTKRPKIFLSLLKESESLDQLKSEFPGLQLDRDILITKSLFRDYKKRKKISIRSFKIENNRDHNISVYHTDSLNQNDLKHYHSIYSQKDDGVSTIRGFYVDKAFTSNQIPLYFSDWINYTDFIVKPETAIFHDNAESSNGYGRLKNTVVDSLGKYFESTTDRPTFIKGQSHTSWKSVYQSWQSKQQYYADSLFQTDAKFKLLLIESLKYAEEHKVSNGYVVDFTEQLISQKRALELIRQHPQEGTCSYDEGPVNQQKRIANLAAKTLNWEVFIQSFLNVLNDNVSRIANSNIASERRKTYIHELVKLELEYSKLLLGSNFRIADTINKHYFSGGQKVAKAFASLDSSHHVHLENAILSILKNDSIDDFNKLHFYNTYRNFQYFLADSLKRQEVDSKIKNLIPFLPESIRSRVDNPNKQIYDLLPDEKAALDKYEIQSSDIGNISSYAYSGDSWLVELIEKGSDGKIIYDLHMPIGETITPFKNFDEQKESLKLRIKKHQFLQEILYENPANKLYLQFVENESFRNHRKRVTGQLPEALLEKLDFKNAISFFIRYPKRKYVRYVLLKNNTLLVLEIPEGFTVPNYSFDELVTETIKGRFKSKIYKSFKLFDEKGKMLN